MYRYIYQSRFVACFYDRKGARGTRLSPIKITTYSKECSVAVVAQAIRVRAYAPYVALPWCWRVLSKPTQTCTFTLNWKAQRRFAWPCAALEAGAVRSRLKQADLAEDPIKDRFGMAEALLTSISSLKFGIHAEKITWTRTRRCRTRWTYAGRFCR